ncbi:MAG: molybdopterin-synthase adenylyltransferase MoeB [Anaerolineales bacterium]|nr:molybdopterin-synthase adenylyltransferase MoeB [Anaerolineales bacterium]
MTETNTSLDLTRDEILRYSRHLLIPEVGMQGQRKLKESSVLVIGTGGLGSPASMYLAAAGVGHIGLVDFDVVDESNLQRQIVHGSGSVGLRKVESARERLLDINPSIHVETYDEPFTVSNAMQIVQPYNVVIDATDNFPTRYLSNDICVKTGKVNIYGSIYRFDGQVSVFWSKHGPCYRCLFPSPPPPGLVPTCAEGGVFGVLPGTIGTLQATEALKVLLDIGEPLVGKLMLYDALGMTFQVVSVAKNPDCPVCSLPPDQIELIDYEAFCGVPGFDRTHQDVEEEWEISPRELAALLQSNPSLILLDVREPHEQEISAIPGAINFPYGTLALHMHELDTTDDLVLFCKTGSRSARALEILLGAGFRKIRHLKGGINAWAKQIDSSLPLY